ncbi:MAG: T9SS type A sorting domain-containing protein [Candidatus Delongbacteria bacterium]
MKRIAAALLGGWLLAGVGTQARAEHPDLGWLTYTGAGSCASPCHVSGDWSMEETARQFTGSVHFQWKADLPANSVFDPDGGTVTGQLGTLNRLDPLSGTLALTDWISTRQASNPALPGGESAGCARCHTSTGRVEPGSLDTEAWRGVDCLICHAGIYQVAGQPLSDASRRRVLLDPTSPTGHKLELPAGEDLSVSSRSITARPSSAACQRCHASADAGRQRRGSHDFLTSDTHAGSLSCVDCHQSEGHRFAGRPQVSQWAVERAGSTAANLIRCATCHSATGQAARPDLEIPIPQHGGIPATHFVRLACEACHIADTRGLNLVSYEQLVRETENGRFLRWAPLTSGQTTPHIPDYLWSNGTIWSDDSPRGFSQTFNNKVTPFHRLEARVPVDNLTGRQLPLDLAVIGDADSLMSNFTTQPEDTLALLDLAVRRGVHLAAAADATAWGGLVNPDGDYTGSWRWESTTQHFPVQHGTRSATATLQCTHCHGTTRLDWEALGFNGDPYIVSVGDEPRPGTFWLGPCRPNPFNNSTIVPFQLEQPGRVDLSVHDLQGRRVLTVLADRPMTAGRHEVQIGAERLPSGVYMYRLRAGQREQTGKMLLIK